MNTRLPTILLVVVAMGCRSDGETDSTPRDTTPRDTTPVGVAPSAGPGSPLLGSCCGHTEALIMRQVALHESTPEANHLPEVAVVPYRSSSGLVKRERIVVEDSATWAALWPRVVGAQSPVPPLPRVDFSREAIVVASMGQQSSGGYAITIDAATTMGDTLRLGITQRSPGPTCMTTAALSSPVALARVVRPTVPIRFIERTAVTDCG